MELTDYWHFIRKWIVLLAAGTLLSALVSYGVVRLHHTAPSYSGAASVLVHYTTPFGVPYNPTLSPSVETAALKQDASDPATVRAIARRYHARLVQITSVAAVVDPNNTAITVTVGGTNPLAVNAVAGGIATYLANLESAKVQTETRVLQQQVAQQAKAARARWYAALVHYNLVSSQITDRASPVLARLQANLSILQQDYQSLSSEYQALGLAPLPAATAVQSQTYTIVSTVASPLKTMLPATALGFLLSLGLAALLDYGEARQIMPTRPARRRLGAAHMVKTPSDIGAGARGGQSDSAARTP